MRFFEDVGMSPFITAIRLRSLLRLASILFRAFRISFQPLL